MTAMLSHWINLVAAGAAHQVAPQFAQSSSSATHCFVHPAYSPNRLFCNNGCYVKITNFKFSSGQHAQYLKIFRFHFRCRITVHLLTMAMLDQLLSHPYDSILRERNDGDSVRLAPRLRTSVFGGLKPLFADLTVCSQKQRSSYRAQEDIAKDLIMTATSFLNQQPSTELGDASPPPATWCLSSFSCACS